MSVPGLNLLGLALTAIGPQPVVWTPWVSSTVLGHGRMVPVFGPPQTITTGSVQAVPRTRYAALGLDYTRNYVTWFTPAPVRGAERDRAPDRFVWAGRLFDVATVTAWAVQDGWSEVVGIDVGSADTGSVES